MPNPTEAFTGTETVGTTEWSLTTDTAGPDVETSDGYFHLLLDLSALAAGDTFEVRLYEKVISSGSQLLVESWTFTGAQGTAVTIIPPVPLLHGWDFTILKKAGTDRSVTWSIRKGT
jgi:hypothetical protein